jgi:hypothetical protein
MWSAGRAIPEGQRNSEEDHCALVHEPEAPSLPQSAHTKKQRHRSQPRRSFCIGAATFTSGLIFVGVWKSAPISRPPVHILMFLADDLGWADVSWHRDESYPESATPALSELRRSGIELDRAYTFKQGHAGFKTRTTPPLEVSKY